MENIRQRETVIRLEGGAAASGDASMSSLAAAQPSVQHAGPGGRRLVSVVIPTYRRAAFVVRAVQRVLRQTHSDLELIVVDDGSRDDTEAAIAAIADPRVRYVRHETNRGVSAARNTGIIAARGGYIALMDDDDDWREDKLERQLAALQEHDAVACLAMVNGHPTREHARAAIMLEDLKSGTFSPSSMVAKAHVLRDVMFDESLSQGEDWDVFIRMRQRYCIGWVDEPLLIYNGGRHERATNKARHMRIQELEKRTAVLYKHREFLGEEWFRYHLADTLLSFIVRRRNRWSCLAHATRRCGAKAVAAVLIGRGRRRVRRWLADQGGS